MKQLLLAVMVVAMAYQASAFDFEYFKRDATCDREFVKCRKHLMGMQLPDGAKDMAELERWCGQLQDACLNFSRIPASQNCGGELGKEASPGIKQMLGTCQKL